MSSMNETAKSIKYEKSDEALTAHSGLLLFAEAMKRYGIIDAFNDTLPKPGSNRGYLPSDYLIPTMLSMAGGGRTMEDVQKILDDKVLQETLTLRQFDASTQSKWLREKAIDIEPKLHRIDNNLITRGLKDCGQTELTADIDAMMIESEKHRFTVATTFR